MATKQLTTEVQETLNSNLSVVSGHFESVKDALHSVNDTLAEFKLTVPTDSVLVADENGACALSMTNCIGVVDNTELLVEWNPAQSGYAVSLHLS